MKINGAQGIILLIGFFFLLFNLFLILAPFNIYYAPSDFPDPDITPIFQVTCPAPIDKTQCDDWQGEIREAVCEDCQRIADARMRWFIVLESMVVIGMIAGFFIAGRAYKPESGASGSV